MPKKSKYGAVAVIHNGRRFASKLEASIAQVLELLQSQKKITILAYQPKFELTPKPNKITYVGDFLILDRLMRRVVVDAKGVETATFRLKKKLMAHFHPNTPVWIIKKGSELVELINNGQ